MNRKLPLPFALACACTIVVSALASAQSPAVAVPPSSASSGPDTKKVLGLADIGRWNRITNAALSADGKWMTYVVTPNEGDGTLLDSQLDGSKAIHDPRRLGAGLLRRLALRRLLRQSAERRGWRTRAAGAEDAGRPRPARSRRRRRAASSCSISSTGEKYAVPEANTFKFAKGSRFVAVRTNKANPSRQAQRQPIWCCASCRPASPRTSATSNLYDFDDAGRMLAYTVDAADRIGNGVYVIDLATSQSKVLSSASMDYDQLTWGDKGGSLAALRGDKKKENVQRDNTLLVWQRRQQRQRRGRSNTIRRRTRHSPKDRW